MIKIIRKPKTQQSELEKHPELCVLVCAVWKDKPLGLTSYLRGFSCIDRGEYGNKKLLEELNFLQEIARLKIE